MINSTLKGPGFFIFFKTEKKGGGSGFPYPIIFLHKREENKVRKKISKKLKILTKNEKNVYSNLSIEKVANELIKDWNPSKAINKFNIDKIEAIDRYNEYIKLYIQSIEDEEVSLMLIMAYSI